MSIKKTIGGNRVGSGSKMEARLHNWFRSTHNLSEKWASSMGSGILYPCCVKLATRGDRFDIDVEAMIRTIPTRKALFGSYKMQIDFYQCPIRLYQALLHNNPLALGLNMSDVKYPILELEAKGETTDQINKKTKINDSALLKYLGLSGLGTAATAVAGNLKRNINAIPALAYYDIYKTYYANKQEEKGVIICPNDIEPINALYRVSAEKGEITIFDYEPYKGQLIDIRTINIINIYLITENPNDVTIATKIHFTDSEDSTNTMTLMQAIQNNITTIAAISNINDENKWQYTLVFDLDALASDWSGHTGIIINSENYTDNYTSKLGLEQFDLSLIDDMRYDLLSHHELGVPFKISQEEHYYYPYKALVEENENEIPWNQFPLNGLCCKTYQNDIFNNWLNTEWIEGENGINEISKVQVVDGKFSMDALLFARKRYNMLVRVAVAGGTYEDWQDVQYEEVKRRQIETPIFIGGMSQEVVFDEVVQTTPTEDSALGTIGSRGRNSKQTQKGGKFHVKCDEACFIIGIISLTPRIFYTQGNEFYLTDVLSMDDIHKPAMDGIGFQDLIGERLAWWDTKLAGGSIVHRSKVGKLPAWIEYMTSYDRAFGDMAGEYGKGFMILNRNYERDEDTSGIKDATTYIDPSKYNYSFAYSALDAQNFWCELAINIKARRLMSAKVIPQV